MKLTGIKKQIANLGEEKIKEIQQKYTFNGITPYEYQCVMFDEIGKRIAAYKHPFFVKASVSAGKTIGFAMIAKRCTEMKSKAFPDGLSMMVLARQAEIVSQDSEEISNFGVPNSVYCAGLKSKKAYFPIVVGSEGTVANGLFKTLGDFTPMVLGIDECHQVDWEDLADAIEKKETYEVMSTSKKDVVMVVTGKDEYSGKDILSYLIGDDGNPIKGTGRTQYTIIIIELMRRCMEKYGKELRVFGMTGSEFRGVTPILVEDKNVPGFWREQVTNIDTNYLIEFGSVVPTTFGKTDDLHYDLDEFKGSAIDGVQDFDEKTMRAMEKKINESGTMTKQIMSQVYELTKNRNAVLVTCAGQRHCQEAADALPPGTTYAIITEKTTASKREKILSDVREGKIKFTFQVMALTTGVNVPNWDTSVILRKIGSLTLLIQLLGRGMRLLKAIQIAMGMVKNDHLVLDYAGTMDDLGALYFDPILEQSQFQRRGEGGKEEKECPICKTKNSFYARRCMNVDDNGERCEYFWKSRRCEDQYDERTGKRLVKGCNTENDIVARVCRCCDVTLLDPNLKLTGKAYSKNDWYDVADFSIGLTKNQAGIIFNYTLINHDGEHFKAYERFFPQSDNKICRVKWKNEGVLPHVKDDESRAYFIGVKNALKIMQYAHKFAKPIRVTHRKNGKKEDIISRKDFGGEIDY